METGCRWKCVLFTADLENSIINPIKETVMELMETESLEPRKVIFFGVDRLQQQHCIDLCCNARRANCMVYVLSTNLTDVPVVIRNQFEKLFSD